MSTLTICFYAVFISQVFLLSYYYPRKIHQRIRYVLKNYPPAQYAKLYPMMSAELAEMKCRTGLNRFRNLSIAVALLGIGLLITAFVQNWSPALFEVEAIVALYAMAQFIPIGILSITEYQQLKLMRMVNRSSKRTSNLQARRLFDFISPIFILLAIGLIVANSGLDIYLAAVDSKWDSDLLIKILSTNMVHVFFAAMIGYHLYGKKPNPLQSQKDRISEIQTLVKSAVFVSMAASAFFIFNTALDLFDASVLDGLAMSIYFQFIGVFGLGMLMRSMPIEQIDFEPYKTSSSTLLN